MRQFSTSSKNRGNLFTVDLGCTQVLESFVDGILEETEKWHAGQLALIVGSPSPSLLQIGTRLRERGASVLLATPSDSPDRGKLERHSELFESISFDLRDRSAWADVARDLNSRGDQWGILVNCIGEKTAGSIEDIGENEWDRSMSADVESISYACQAAVRHFRGEDSAIVNVCSIGGLVAGDKSILIDVVGGSVRLLTKSVALHCLDREIPVRCNSVHSICHPGSWGATESPEDRRYTSSTAALSRGPSVSCTHSDTAEMVSFLARRTNCGITGQEFVVDGGRTVR
jgi:3(or 17)beta-hydroxysteroid dehydrogenase